MSANQTQGGGGDVEELRPTKLSSTSQGGVPALYPPWAPVFPSSAAKKLQGLHFSSAKKQIETCEDFRKSYSLHGAMQACDLDRHSVKGPGVDATYTFLLREAPVSSCDLNVLSQLVPTLLRGVSPRSCSPRQSLTWF